MLRRKAFIHRRYQPRLEMLENRTLPSATPYFDAIINDNPETYWRLNESNGPTAFDSSGNGNDGVFAGNVLFGQPGVLPHESDAAAQFDGQTAYALFDNTISGSFTVEAWIKTTANSRTGTQGYHGNAIVWSDVAFIHNDWIVAVLNNHLTFFTGNPDTTIEGTTNLNDGEWHHIVAIRVQGGQKRIYLDGQLEAVGATNNSLLNDRPEIAVGGNSIDSRSFNGTVDEVALYNYALTEQQVMAHYLAGFNNLPIPEDDDIATSEGTPVIIDPLSNDFDPDGDALALTDFEQPANGVVVVDDNDTPDDATDDFLVYTPNPGFFGDDSFTYSVVDPTGGSGVASVFVTVNPVTPAVHAGGPSSINEGDTISGSGFFVDPGVDTWTATVDYGDGSGTQGLSLNPDKTFNLQHQYADNGSFTVTVTVTDDDLHVGTAQFLVAVNNVNPNVHLAGPDFGVRGQPRQFVLTASDIGIPDAEAGFEYSVDWGDTSSVQVVGRSAGNGAGVELPHTFTASGEYAIQVTAVDKDNGASTVFTHTVHFTAFGIQDDPLHPGQLIFVVGGTADADSIFIRPGPHKSVNVIVNDLFFGSLPLPSQIVVYGQGGNDFVQIAGPLQNLVLISTGAQGARNSPRHHSNGVARENGPQSSKNGKADIKIGPAPKNLHGVAKGKNSHGRAIDGLFANFNDFWSF